MNGNDIYKNGTTGTLTNDPFTHLKDAAMDMTAMSPAANAIMPATSAIDKAAIPDSYFMNFSMLNGRLELTAYEKEDHEKLTFRTSNGTRSLNNEEIIDAIREIKNYDAFVRSFKEDGIDIKIICTSDRSMSIENRKAITEFQWNIGDINIKSVNHTSGLLLNEVLEKDEFFNLHEESKYKSRSLSIAISPTETKYKGEDIDLSNLKIKIYMNNTGCGMGYIALVSNNLILSVTQLNFKRFGELQKIFGIKPDMLHQIYTEVI